jgi:hypothetical protein
MCGALFLSAAAPGTRLRAADAPERINAHSRDDDKPARDHLPERGDIAEDKAVVQKA